MDINRLIRIWIEPFNQHYTNYLFNEQEPRYSVKQFFLYSYNLFDRLGSDWSDYIEKYSELFRRDPSNDYYGHRDPCDLNTDEARKNTLEWAIIFEVLKKIGFPYNNSAEVKLFANAKKYLSKAIQSPEANFHDIMICSAIENLPEYFIDFKELLPKWLSIFIQKSEPTVHQLIAYLNALKNSSDTEKLKIELKNRISMWVSSPTETPRKQILIWARLATRIKSDIFSDPEIQEKIKTNFFHNLSEIHDIEWFNRPIILEAAYILSDTTGKNNIIQEISRQIIPSTFLRLKEIFPFLREDIDSFEIQSEIETIKEKCRSNPSRELCDQCMTATQGECWIRVLAKITDSTPWTHGPFEIGDIVIYTLEQSVYFVIKANQISRQRGEGDVLYRQCAALFSNDHALILYWNPFDTAPMVIENIRRLAGSMATNPRFEVVGKKYIRQVYNQYKSIQN